MSRTEHSILSILRQWSPQIIQLLIVMLVYTLVWFVADLGMLPHPLRSGSTAGSWGSSLFVGAMGALGWFVVCRCEPWPALGRAVMAGVFSIVVIFPLSVLWATISSGGEFPFVAGMGIAIIAFVFMGLFLVPVGFVAALICWLIGGARHYFESRRPGDKYDPFD